MAYKYFIGVDEAGYGPNLGPLIVAATLWRTGLGTSEQELCHSLSGDFLPRTWTANCSHIPLGDSKKLYQSTGGLATLETGLLALALPLCDPCKNLRDVIQRFCAPDTAVELRALPWYADFGLLSVPQGLTDIREAQRLAALASSSLQAAHIELVDLQAAIVTEPKFNASIEKTGSKAEILSTTSLDLVVRLLEQCAAPTEVYCDRQGGRKNYLPQLLEAMPDEWFTELSISNARSSYRNTGECQRTIHFSVGGDSFPPTALASMLAKYLRERLMESLNAFWRQHVEGLKPTAGYPVDARRFRAQIEPIAERLQLAVAQWWRCK